MYHSSALLLPDATVWSAGSQPNSDTWEPHMEIYKPPYLFTSSGALAPRPTIASLPSVVGYGQSFTVTTPDAANISKVMFVRPGSSTHGFDMDQRLIYTYFTKGSGQLTVTAPSNMGAAPPGYYMLFLLDGNGVPSVAKFFQLTTNPAGAEVIFDGSLEEFRPIVALSDRPRGNGSVSHRVSDRPIIGLRRSRWDSNEADASNRLIPRLNAPAAPVARGTITGYYADQNWGCK